MEFASFIFVLCVFAATSHALEPQVQLSLGKIKGSIMYTRTNRTIFSFRGVKYGKDTAGERRFKVSWEFVKFPTIL